MYKQPDPDYCPTLAENLTRLTGKPWIVNLRNQRGHFYFECSTIFNMHEFRYETGWINFENPPEAILHSLDLFARSIAQQFKDATGVRQ